MPCTGALSGGVQSRASMDTYRAPKANHADADADDSDELGVFAAERYFYGDDDDALWPWERSSSSLSSAFRTGTHDHDTAPTPTAVTSSSEASWNSRSALLPTEPPEKLHAVPVAVAASTPIVEARPSDDAEGQRTGRRPASSSNHLGRWLLGVAACACAGGGASEESVSADEMETVPEATAARPSGRWLLEGDKPSLAGGMDGHRGGTNLGELSTPILHPQTAAATDERRRRIKSLEMFRPVPVPVGDHGSALGSAMQSSAPFTIVAGNPALGGDGAALPRAASGGGSPAGEDDDAAPTPSELGCAYPPSEASVVWSVVTADGAASGNFSSAASGYHHHYHYCFNDVHQGAMRRAAARNTHKRRSGIAGGSSLLMCMSDKAVDAVGPAAARSVHRQEVRSLNSDRQPEQPWNVQAYQDTIRRR